MQCHMALIGRQRVTTQACRNPLSPFGLRRQRGRLDFYHGLLGLSGLATPTKLEIPPPQLSNATLLI